MMSNLTPVAFAELRDFTPGLDLLALPFHFATPRKSNYTLQPIKRYESPPGYLLGV